MAMNIQIIIGRESKGVRAGRGGLFFERGTGMMKKVSGGAFMDPHIPLKSNELIIARREIDSSLRSE